MPVKLFVKSFLKCQADFSGLLLKVRMFLDQPSSPWVQFELGIIEATIMVPWEMLLKTGRG